MLVLHERPFFEVDDPDGGIPLASTGDAGDSDHNSDSDEGNSGD